MRSDGSVCSKKNKEKTEISQGEERKGEQRRKKVNKSANLYF